MLTFHKLAWVHHSRHAVFRVLTPEAGVAYMSVDSGSAARSVVEVDAMRLLALWRYPETRLVELAYGNPDTWRKDYKFALAAAGFAEGEANPVPLADVGCAELEQTRLSWKRRFWFWKTLVQTEVVRQRHFDFGDGVTRTIWLLAHGAEVFPIECATAEAPLLQALAGAAGGGRATVAELVPEYSDHYERLREIKEANASRRWPQQ